jgi:signal transduction histidine kinase/ActR/RegA family two-component response regulator
MYADETEESSRMQVLHSLNILDSLPEEEYNNIAKLVSCICNVPISLVTLVDEKRQWFKAKLGMDPDETPRDKAFCNYTIAQNTPFIVENALEDDRFVNNQYVTGSPDIRFYAGTQIKVDGKNVGSLCAIDRKPRRLTKEQVVCLTILAEQVSTLLSLRKFHKISCSTLDELGNMVDEKTVEKRLEKIKQSLISNISHEIKTPLNGIISTTESLLEIAKGEDDLLLLQTLMRSSDDLVTVFVNLFDLAQEGPIVLNKEKVLLRKTVEDIMMSFSLKAREKLIDFTFSNRMRDGITVVDTVRLGAVMSNLLSNAIKFTDVKGSIHVDVEESAGQDRNSSLFFFKVTDTGIGIRKENAADLFKPFLQLDMTGKKQYKGTGNGLAVSKKIVESMNGNIDYSSEYGQGSCFFFVVPLDKMDLSSSSSILNGEEKDPLNSVLVVDDNPLNQIIATALLKKIVPQVFTEKADNGQAAVDAVLAKDKGGNKFDFILMDCQMPILDGFDATSKIRETEQDVVIVALTASSEKNDLSRCLSVGMNDVLTKPVTAARMKEKIEKYFTTGD